VLDDVLHDALFDDLVGDIGRVLSADKHSVHADGNNHATSLLVLDSDLSLRIGAGPRQDTLLAAGVVALGELRRKEVRQGVQLSGFVGGIAKHETLITGAHILVGLAQVNTLRDVWRLLLDGNKNIAALVVEALVAVVVANVPDGFTDDLLVVEDSQGGDLSQNHDHARLGCRFASNKAKKVKNVSFFLRVGYLRPPRQALRCRE